MRSRALTGVGAPVPRPTRHPFARAVARRRRRSATARARPERDSARCSATGGELWSPMLTRACPRLFARGRPPAASSRATWRRVVVRRVARQLSHSEAWPTRRPSAPSGRSSSRSSRDVRVPPLIAMTATYVSARASGGGGSGEPMDAAAADGAAAACRRRRCEASPQVPPPEALHAAIAPPKIICIASPRRTIAAPSAIAAVAIVVVVVVVVASSLSSAFEWSGAQAPPSHCASPDHSRCRLLRSARPPVAAAAARTCARQCAQ